MVIGKVRPVAHARSTSSVRVLLPCLCEVFDLSSVD